MEQVATNHMVNVTTVMGATPVAVATTCAMLAVAAPMTICATYLATTAVARRIAAVAAVAAVRIAATRRAAHVAHRAIVALSAFGDGLQHCGLSGVPDDVTRWRSYKRQSYIVGAPKFNYNSLVYKFR